MKKVLIIILFLVSSFMTGCFNYRDINEAYFVTATIVDIDTSIDNGIVIYEEAFKPTRSGDGKSGSSSSQGQRIIFKGKGKTIFEAVRDINNMSSYKLNFTQSRAIIFTQRAAEHGMADFIDFFQRDQETINRAYLAIYIGDLEDLLKADFKAEEYIGLFIPNLIRNVGSSSRTVELQLNDYLVKRIQASKTTVVTVIRLEKDYSDTKIKTNGGAVIKADKMVGVLDPREGQGYNFLNNQIKVGTLEITNPDDPNRYVTLEILKSSTKTELTYEREQVHLKKVIRTKTTLGEVQGKLIFNKANIDKIRATAEQNIIRACNEVFNKYKDKGIDIFEVQNSFHRKYPHDNDKDIIKRTYLELEVQVDVEGSTDTNSFE